ncbi:hypothetical protein PTKIN_Ptkin17bG0044800 [Pterospermum kingtungense]
MAELKESSRKRKRLFLPTTRSLIGNFTRTKSQIHLHRNRSAQSPPDSTGGGNHLDQLPFFKKQKNSSPFEDSSVGYDLSSVSIKDLRSRRVFSLCSSNGVIANCLGDAKILGNSEIADGSRENGDFKRLGMLNEDFVQSTPPDAEMIGAKQVRERNGSDISDEFVEKKLTENLQKTVLKPCSRMKLLRTPGSFSYRRLLPYLMDMEKDYSRSPLMGHCQKTEKGLEEKQLVASTSQETSADKSKTTRCSSEGHDSDSGKGLNTVSVETLTSQDNESSSMSLVSEAIQKLELQVSCDKMNLNCSKHDSSSTIEDSELSKEKLAGPVSGHKMLIDDGEIAKTNVETPCNAQNLEGLDQTLPAACDYHQAAQSSNIDTKQSGIEGMPKATICHSFEAQHLNSVNPTLSELEGNRKCRLQQRVDNDAEFVEHVEDLNGEHTLVTPTDSNMPSRTETDDSRGNRVDCLSQGIDHSIEKSSNYAFQGNNGQDSEKSLDSSPKNKLVPNPRLHMKLSKVAGSFNYRRLLPFLTDVTNEYSCASGNNQSLKTEKCSKEKLLSPFFTSRKNTCTETCSGKSCPVEHYTVDDVMLPVAPATARRCSSNHKLTRSPPKLVADSPMIMDSEQEQGYLVKNAAMPMDSNKKLKARPENVIESPDMSTTSLTNSRLLPREEDAKLVSYQLPLETEEHYIKSPVKCANSEKQIEADSFVEASIPPGIPAAGLKKGILRRNPRGCRGICTCLNCSSFRLHAVRSFEFSRNQMQDAEEVALDLIKELSCLRDMLEKSAFAAKDQPRICTNQVKEACKKASDAEEVAKARLTEMNYNLNVHCRIPSAERPSVRFANYVEELVAPMADSSNK